MLVGDIHPNPGQFDNSLKFCHWNLNGVCARDKIKIPLLEAYKSSFHYDLIALFETNLNETIKNEDIIIDGFSTEIFRSDHPSGDRQGGVCVYLKENLPVKLRKDLEILQETVIGEISLGHKKVFFVALYRSPNQSNEDSEEFYHKLQDTLDNIKVWLTSEMITTAKDNYFASLGRKLSNPAIGIKTYWSTLNKIVNKKKVTNIPHYLQKDYLLLTFRIKLKYLMIILFSSFPLTWMTVHFPDLLSLDAITFWQILKSMPTKFWK